MSLIMQLNRDIIGETIGLAVAAAFVVAGLAMWRVGRLGRAPKAPSQDESAETPDPATGFAVLDSAMTTGPLPPAETYTGHAQVLPHYEGSYFERTRDAVQRLHLGDAWTRRHSLPWVGEYEPQPVQVGHDPEVTVPLDPLFDQLPEPVAKAMRTTPGTGPVPWPVNGSRWSTTYRATGVR